MLLALESFGLLLAILSILLISTSFIVKEKSMINRERLELAGIIAGLAFLAVAFYLMWGSLI